jgi:rhodanese-related sulfurtransferase
MTSTTETLAPACALPGTEAPGDPAGTPAIPLVSPAIAAAAVAGGALLVDVRSAGYRAKTGGLPQAVIADRERIRQQFDVEGTTATRADGTDASELLPGVTGREQSIVVICGSVNGSLPVAEELRSLGFANVVHVDGGFTAWKDAGLPTTPPTAPIEEQA